MKRFWSLSFLAALTLLSACKHQEEIVVEPVEVEALQLTETSDIKTTPYVGRVLAAQSSTIASSNAGTLKSIEVKAGQMVQEGQIIAEVWSENVRNAHTMAKSTLAQAEDGYARMMQLYKDGGVTELKRMEVESQLEKARAAMKSAEYALEKCHVRSPFRGVVEEIYIEEGIDVNPAMPLLKLSNINAVEIHIPVPENEISKVRIGQEANLEVAALQRCGRAHVIVKGVTASEISHTYTCILNPATTMEGLLPGMVCEVFLKEETGPELVVPLDCVMTDTEGRYVWTVDEEGLVSKTRITVKDFSAHGVIVEQGLEAGDRVVTDGRRKISSGMKVKVKVVQ